MPQTKNGGRKVSAQKVSAQNRRKQATPLTPAMALSMLESAVSYCQQSGLNIQAANSQSGMLGLFIPNAHYIITDNGTKAAFRLGELPETRDYAGIVAEPLPTPPVSALSDSSTGTETQAANPNRAPMARHESSAQANAE